MLHPSKRKYLFLAVFSGVLLLLSYPPFNLEFLAWIAFVPWLMILYEERDLQNVEKLDRVRGVMLSPIMFWIGQHLCPNLPKRRWRPSQSQKIFQPIKSTSRIATHRSSKPSRPINRSRSLLYFVIIACVAALALYTYQNGVENTLDDISNIASNVMQQVKETTGNLTQTIQNVSKPVNRVYFESVDALVSFLDADNVSDIEWTEDFVCADFTDLLIKRAEAAGYNTILYRGMYGIDLYSFSEVMDNVSYTNPYGRTWGSGGLDLSYLGPGGGHAVCETTIGNKTILIEPQNDMIFELANGVYTVLYKGEITKYGQKLPEPEDRTYFDSIDDLVLFLENDPFNEDGGWIIWDSEKLAYLKEKAIEHGCNTLLHYSIGDEELGAYADALSSISYRSGNTIWSYGTVEYSAQDTKIVYKTTIGNCTIVIDPPTDIVFEFKDGEYIVLHKGEITKNEE